MRVTVHDAPLLEAGMYPEDIKRQDGSRVSYLVLHGGGTQTVRMTLAPDLKLETLPGPGQKVNVEADYSPPGRDPDTGRMRNPKFSVTSVRRAA